MIGFFKNKLTIIITTVVLSVVISLGIYLWYVSGQLDTARENIANLRSALTTSEESVSSLEEELEIRERIISERDERERDLRKSIEGLREVIGREREINEAINDCWDVPISDELSDRLRRLSTYID